MTLTPAQIAVVTLVAKGLMNKEIAFRLGLEEATVKSHLCHANKRLGMRNRVQIAVWWVNKQHEEGRPG